MTTANVTTKFFQNKRVFLHFQRACYAEKAAQFIKQFGGQLETFLDDQSSYVLTDIEKNEWPPNGRDGILRKAYELRVKVLSYVDLIGYCSRYLASQSSSDEDDETRGSIKILQPPYIKFEDYNCKYAPTYKEFLQWPELRLAPFNEQGYTNLQVGKSFFNENAGSENNSTNTSINRSAQITPIVNNPSKIVVKNGTNMNNNNVIHRGVKRRNSTFCEICNSKIEERIEDHVVKKAHLDNTDKQDWGAVNLVIETLPSLSSLNMKRLTNLTQPIGLEHQEFFCLHNMESVSQLFLNSK